MKGIKREVIALFFLFTIISVIYFIFYDSIVTRIFPGIFSRDTFQKFKNWNFLIITVFFMVEIIRAAFKGFREKEEKLKSLTESVRMFNRVPAMLFTTDGDERITQVSDYLLEVLGYTRDEVIGHVSMDFLVKDSKKYIDEEIRPGYLTSGTIKNIQCRVVKKDQSEINVILSAVAEKSDSGEFIRNQNVITDITKLTDIENTLAESRDFYQKIISAIPDIFIQTDVEGNIIYVNDIGLEKLREYSISDIMGKNIISLVTPDYIEKATTNLRLMLEKPLGINEYNLIMNDSVQLTCEINGQVLRQFDGTPYGMIFVIRDITQRKKFEKELRASETRSRSFIETSSNIVFEVATDGSITYLNPKSREILGYPLEELYKKRIFDLVSPDHLARTIKRLNEDLEQKKRTLSFEVAVIHGTNNQELFLEINTDPILTDSGDILGFRGIARDITARKHYELEIKESKEQLEMVLKEGMMGFWYTDIPGDLTYIDNTWASILGYSQDEISVINYERLARIFYPDDKLQIDNFILSLGNGALSDSSLEHRMLTKQGDVKWVSSVAKAVNYDSKNRPTRIIGLMRDITDRKIAELKIIEANATKDKLFSIIAHDLKNPFSTILGFSELLKNNINKYNTEKIADMANHINISANSLYSLLVNLLEWANSQRGKTQFNPTRFDFEKLVENEINYISYFAKQKKVTINSFNNNLNISADYNLLKIITRNLITNAIKYSNPGGKVDIYSILYKDRVEVTISDDGIGMSDEVKSKLFTFEKVKSQKGTANEQGSGLGLMLCKEYIEMHKGKLWVESKPGKGSKFSFSLPFPE
ncbi:MAG: hypothetical protein A2X13_04760 [Bacteroidetes bacterium GWC2_33_15]|nr:MAG: hypothetical protein A2X10_06605 [Bacteroidetes bacterium GWA2_33_15]OFX49836.1 MAG: hypothetical protein A2X13_04760 [Bacteroidetes bacterium GWC2_33_15]OFX65027.1 MAG: hypothetical protein A2X15_06680 [Bacteroidetes bacterium GWB2_32_14]OFX69011.1 MAG: hypothetical protein A2X14_13475 [Bacteroidetes bacterium GWD2_33_33]HAN18277.1 hypothetical protein [Bacteroidales bacterium]